MPFSGFAANTIPGVGTTLIPGVGTPGSLVTYGPAVVSPAAFRSGVTARQASWFVLPPAPVMARQNIAALAGRTSQVVTKLTTLILPSGLQVTTRLPQVLDGIASNIVLARSLFTIGALELLLVAGAALVLAARLLASLRDEESALLRARGATRWQLTRPVLAEALVIGAAAGAVGVLAGVRLTGVLASAGQLHLDSYQASRISPLAWLSALAMLALCAAVMAWPALRAGTPDAARIRQGRQARLAGVAWAGGDLAVVALAALAVWQLRGYSAVAHPAAGSLGIDPVIAIAPALALAGVALVPLRTLPLLARLADGATEHGRRLAAAMVSWQIGRRPIRQAGPVLLVVVATATTTLALAGWRSWQQSAADQAAFAVGSDVRVDAGAGGPLDPRAITGEPGVTAATPASIASIGSGGQLIAVGAGTAGQAILLRPDLSPLPLSSLWRSIIPRRPTGLALPGRPDRLQILVTLGASPGTSTAALRRELGSVTVTASVQDADGVSYVASPPGCCPPTASGMPWSSRCPARGRPATRCGCSASPSPLSCRRTTRPARWPPPPPTSASSPSRWPGRPAARSAGRSATVPPWRRGRPRDPRRACRPGRRACSRRRRHRTAHGPRSCAGTAPPGEASSSRSIPGTIRRHRS